jgi:hypothetical protein
MSNSKVSFGKWILVSLLTYTVFDLIFVSLAGLALSLSPRNLMQPFALIFCCGVIASTLLYWTRESYGQPKSCACRLALSFFVYLLLFMSVLIFGAMKNGFISRHSLLAAFALFVCPGSTIAAVVVYFTARNKLSTRNTSELGYFPK